MSTEPLQKVDSAVAGLSESPKEDKKRRTSSSVTGIYNINDLGKLARTRTLELYSGPQPTRTSNRLSLASYYTDAVFLLQKRRE